MATDAPRRVSRRRLLRAGLGGALALGAGALLAGYTVGYGVPDEIARSLRSLSPKEYLIVEALAARMMRPDGPDLPDPRSLRPGLLVDSLAAQMDDATRTDLGRVLNLLEHLLPVGNGHATRFTRLGGEAQDEVLRSMMQSSQGLLRGAFDSLKSLCALAYFSHPSTWAAIGYDGPLVGRPPGGWGAGGWGAGR